MPNRLANESSLYLRQHANNPVDWYPWGPEALAACAKLEQPIFLSIGYSACHWCHVMEHESFEDIAIAAVLNEHFVCIKVDREERPDLDDIYMKAVQLLTKGTAAGRCRCCSRRTCSRSTPAPTFRRRTQYGRAGLSPHALGVIAESPGATKHDEMKTAAADIAKHLHEYAQLPDARSGARTRATPAAG